MKKSILALLITFTLCHSTSYSSELNDAIESGKQEFLDSCALCHGNDAKGNGVFSTMLTVPVADLTVLTNKYGGQFPFFEVYMTIDGRDQIRPHELMNMPMWGKRFTHVFNNSIDQEYTDTLVRGRIFEVMLYLQSIQE